MRRLWPLAAASLLAFGLGLTAGACAKARHVAVVADATVAQAVFALDDAELAACQAHVLTEAQCAALNPLVKQALVDVRSVTAAIKASPATGKVPVDLPSLLKGLTDIQAIVGPLSAVGGPVGVLATKTKVALDQAIAVLTPLAGVGK